MNLNLVLIFFIVGFIAVLVWFTFNTIRQIDIQKNYCARVLTEVAKLWRRAKFVPEDAKERESLYLYRDFLRKFEGEKCKYPLMLKNGGVRCMTRQEFDNFAGFKPVKSVSSLTVIASVLVAVVAVVANVLSNTIWVGVGLAIILPIVQVLCMFFLKKLIKEKDVYRDGLFLALKENCINFVTITKPFIVVDAYPNKFGKNAEPIYVAKGEPTIEQIHNIRNFIATQRNLDRSAMLTNPQAPTQPEQVMEPIAPTPTYMETMPTQPEFTETPVDANAMYNVNPLAEMPAPAMTEPAPVMPEVNSVTDADDDMDTLPEDFPLLSDEEAEELMSSFIGNIMKGEVDRQVQAIVEEKNAAAKTVEAAAPALDETAATEPVMEAEPAEDDFSLEAIGRALDAEIAKRNGKK